MRNGTGISSVNDGKVAYTQEEAKEKHRGGDRSRDKHRVGHRNRNTSTCGSEAGGRDRGITPLPPLPITVRRGEIETGEIETFLIRASVSLKKIETDLLGSWWP